MRIGQENLLSPSNFSPANCGTVIPVWYQECFANCNVGHSTVMTKGSELGRFYVCEAVEGGMSQSAPVGGADLYYPGNTGICFWCGGVLEHVVND